MKKVLQVPPGSFRGWIQMRVENPSDAPSSKQPACFACTIDFNNEPSNSHPECSRRPGCRGSAGARPVAARADDHRQHDSSSGRAILPRGFCPKLKCRACRGLSSKAPRRRRRSVASSTHRRFTTRRRSGVFRCCIGCMARVEARRVLRRCRPSSTGRFARESLSSFRAWATNPSRCSTRSANRTGPSIRKPSAASQ